MVQDFWNDSWGGTVENVDVGGLMKQLFRFPQEEDRYPEKTNLICLPLSREQAGIPNDPQRSFDLISALFSEGKVLGSNSSTVQLIQFNRCDIRFVALYE